jgi:thiopeptide-type bacteriocin biosynthesis protein
VDAFCNSVTVEKAESDRIRVERRPYVFETERYGGPAARSIAEAHFQASSRLAMSIVALTRERRAVRLRVAVHLAAVVAIVLGVERRATHRGFRFLVEHLAAQERSTTDAYLLQLEFPLWTDQRSELTALIAQIRSDGDGVESDRSLAQLVRIWGDEVRLRWRELASLDHEGALRRAPEEISMDYLHMLLNRLGLTLPEECYVRYLIACALAEVADGNLAPQEVGP